MQKQLSLEKYRELLNITPVCTVDVLFFNKEKTKTLLFRRVNKPVKGVYFSIGGRLLKGEKMIDAAVRQAKREVGISIKKSQLVFGGVQEEIHRTSIFNNVSYHAVDIFYGYILNKEVIKLDYQHSDYDWFSVTDKTLHPFIKSKIKSILDAYGKKI